MELKYYFYIENGKINGKGQCKDDTAVEVTQEVYEDDIERYIWNGEAVIPDPDYNTKKLAEAKLEKYNEAKDKAYSYLENGEALYEFDTNKHIEATDGNIGKFTAYALKFMAGSTTPVVWCTKEDETVLLNQEQVNNILQGLGAVQAQVWTIKFSDYITAIQEAQTITDVRNITIDYTL